MMKRWQLHCTETNIRINPVRDQEILPPLKMPLGLSDGKEKRRINSGKSPVPSVINSRLTNSLNEKLAGVPAP